MGHTRVVTHIKADMASAYAHLGERARAEQLLNEASAHLENALVNDGGCMNGVPPDDLCHAVAVAYAVLGSPDTAADVLTRAVEKGYRGARWMESDPRLKTLVESGRVDPLLKRIRQLTPVQFRVDYSG